MYVWSPKLALFSNDAFKNWRVGKDSGLRPSPISNYKMVFLSFHGFNLFYLSTAVLQPLEKRSPLDLESVDLASVTYKLCNFEQVTKTSISFV